MGRNWSPKYKVECNWCFWNSIRTKRCLSNRCPKCRKERTVEKFDPDKVYSEEEVVRHREIRMTDAGAREIRPGVWVSERLKIYDDPSLTRLREFDDYYMLYKLLTKEGVWFCMRQAAIKRERRIQIGKSFIEVPQKKEKR